MTREQIVWAYRVLLDRDPETEKAIIDARSYGSMGRLRGAIIACEEFRGRNRSAQAAPEPRPVARPALEVEASADEATAAALLARIKQVWEALGEERPHWSVLSSDEFSPERIAATEAQFYRSGTADVAALRATLSRVGIDTAAAETLFEFGCGVGRVTPHLARHFTRVVACDVSPSHIRLAEATINAAGITNVEIVPAQLPAFGMLQRFDVWFSRIVLQHNPPPVMKLILERALDLLAPGGVAVFQLPTYATGYRFRLTDYLARSGGAGEIEMHVLPQPEIFRIAQRAGCIPLEVAEDESVGIPGWVSSVFVLQKTSSQTRSFAA